MIWWPWEAFSARCRTEEPWPGTSPGRYTQVMGLISGQGTYKK